MMLLVRSQPDAKLELPSSIILMEKNPRFIQVVILMHFTSLSEVIE
jgi:hypothetical protein